VRRVIPFVAFLVGACASPVNAPSPSIGAAGILIVGVSDQVQPALPTEKLKQAFSDATRLAEANGRDIGYPSYDPATGEVVLSAATAQGRALLQGAKVAVPNRIRDVTHGAAELRQIQDDVTMLNARGVVDAKLIYETLPDYRDNRAMIVLSAMSQPLLDYLSAHYPADALAIRVDPSGNG
jgi:hypothetical protein